MKPSLPTNSADDKKPVEESKTGATEDSITEQQLSEGGE